MNKCTAVEAQAAAPPGVAVLVPAPSPTSLSLVTSLAGFLGLATLRLLYGPFDQQLLKRLLLVAGPVTVLTSYPGFTPQGLQSRVGGYAIQIASVSAIAAQGSVIALFCVSLGQAGTYAEGRVQAQVRQELRSLTGSAALPPPGTSIPLTVGDTVRVWGELTAGGLTVDRRRWGPAVLEVLAPGSRVRPGDVVIAGTGSVLVSAPGPEELDLDPRGRRLNGVTTLRPGHTPYRLRRQFFYWSATVALVTLLLTGDIRRVIAVLLAGSPAFEDVVGGATSFNETRKWVRKGILPAHPLGLVAAAEVDTVLFDEPAAPDAGRVTELQGVAARLRRAEYRVGVITALPPAEAQALALAVGADLWFSGTAEERARWVAGFTARSGHLAAVVGSSAASIPSMATAHLGIAGAREAAMVEAAHVTFRGSMQDLPEFLADNRQTGRAEIHGETLTRTLMIGATLAAAAGLLAATSVVTVTSLLGIGLVGLKTVLGGRTNQGKPTTHTK